MKLFSVRNVTVKILSLKHLFNKTKPLQQHCEIQLLPGKAAMQWLCTKALEFCICSSHAVGLVERGYKHTPLEQLEICFPIKRDTNLTKCMGCFLRSFYSCH